MRLSFRSCAGGLVFATIAAACAAAQKPALLDTMTDDFEQAATDWEQSIRNFALRLFYLLATLDVIWTGLVIALKGSGLQEFVAELVRRLLFIGLFLALLLNAHDWSRAIVNSFQAVGAQAVRDSVGPQLGVQEFGSGGELKPSAIAAKGVLYSRRIANSAPSIAVHPGGSVFFGFASLGVLAGFGAIAARQVLVLAEMYVVLSAGVLVLGFGAARWTNDYAVKYYRYCVAVGAKLMFVQISVALAIHFLNGLMSNASKVSFTRAATLSLSMSVLVVLIWTIPNIVAQFMQGLSATSGSEIMSAGQLARAAVAPPGTPMAAQPLREAVRQAAGVPARSLAAALGSGTTLGAGMMAPIGAMGRRLRSASAGASTGSSRGGERRPGRSGDLDQSRAPSGTDMNPDPNPNRHVG